MKLFVLAAMAALMNAQAPVAAKPEATVPKASTAPLERKFTPEEIEKLSLYGAQFQVIRNQHKADELEKNYREFQTDIAPIAAKQRAIVEAACAEIGVPKEKVDAGECGVTFGIGPDGKPINGADGKPVESKVWRMIKTPPVADKK